MSNFLDKCLDKPFAFFFVCLSICIVLKVASKSLPELINAIFDGIKELFNEFKKPATMVHKLNLTMLVFSSLLVLVLSFCTPIWNQIFPSTDLTQDASNFSWITLIISTIVSPTFLVLMKREERLAKLASKEEV